jgi:hypothetical protein|nr:MAG TPA: hypothetical protein [Caudoviricetes sp.]
MIDYNPIEYVTYQVYRRNTGEYVLVFYREDVEGNVYVPEN